jgi:hypothetical protein
MRRGAMGKIFDSDFIPSLVLGDGADGLEAYRSIVPSWRSLSPLLKPGSIFMSEIRSGQASSVT